MAKARQLHTAEWVSVTVLLSEAAVALVVLQFLELSREAPDATGGAGLGAVVLFPFLALLACAVCYLVSAFVVLPTIALATWLGRRATGRADVWWWAPTTGPAVAGLAAVAAAVLGAGSRAALWSWLITAAAITTAALPTRLALHDSWRTRGGRLIRRTIGGGAAAVVLTVIAGATVYGTGLATEYAPPRLTTATLAATWSDGHGGTLTLAPHGIATASALDEHDISGSRTGDCTASGTWEFDRGDSARSQELTLRLTGCDAVDASWYVLGTEERPTLYAYLGDPDSWDLYVLRKRE